MRRSNRLGVWVGIAMGIAACGGSAPSERDIWHSEALKPGAVPTTNPGERELLTRLPELPPGQAVKLGDQVFTTEPAYMAASGRPCRPVYVQSPTGSVRRLACDDWQGWVFVPDPFEGLPSTEVPFSEGP